MSTATKYNQTVKWPNDNFVCRVIDESFAPSKASGNPMITLTFETVGMLKNDNTTTDEVDIGGEDFMIAGVKLVNYYPTIVLDGDGVNVEKTKKAQARVVELYEKFNLDASINFENPVLAFKGKSVMVYLQDEAKPKRRSPTKEQLDAGIREGEIVLNPITREPVIDHWPKLNRIYGLAV
mgnify:FL=1